MGIPMGAPGGDGCRHVPGEEAWVHVRPQRTLPKLFPPASGHPSHVKPCMLKVTGWAEQRSILQILSP